MTEATATKLETPNQYTALLCWSCYGPVKKNELIYDGHRFCSGSCAWNFFVTCPICGATATDFTRGSSLNKQCSENSNHKWTHCSTTHGIVTDHKCGCQPLSPFDSAQKPEEHEQETLDPLDNMKRIMEQDELSQLESKFTVRSVAMEITERVRQLKLQEQALKLKEGRDRLRRAAVRLKVRHPAGSHQPPALVETRPAMKQQQ